MEACPVPRDPADASGVGSGHRLELSDGSRRLIMGAMEVSELAKDTRRELNRLKQSEDLSQRDIALRCKTNPGFVSQVLSGDGELQTDTIERIAKGLGYRVVIQFEPIEEHAAAS